LDPDSPRHAEAAARGYLVADGTGKPASLAGITADGRPRALVDFSNPAARAWWQDLHRELLALGVAVFTTDFGEGLPEDAVMADGRPGRAWRNLYPLWYNRTVAEVTREATGGPGLVWGRSGWAGSQRYPGQWGGDPESSVAGMAATLRAGLSWAVSAPGLWGHDIGGFSGAGPTPELYVRWAQWGCLSPLTRFHGIGRREPWAFGERALGIVRDFAALRYRLLPYLDHLAGEAARWGWPVLRPLALEHPGDRGSWGLAHQYLLGADLLVVPVLDDGPGPVRVPCYLPPGTWVDWWSGEARYGPGWVVEEVPLERLPLFVRGGAVVPLGPDAQHTGEAPAEAPWTLHAYPDPGRPARETELLDGGTVWHARPVLADDGGIRAVALAGTGGEAPGRRAVAAVVHLPGARLAEVPVVGA
ncbi:MAG TPA: TIM-barrel domain-containing protein, partial [Acidimicrobiales bacterium]|nr:TIM-barrel domain-containing protein [Acidimicrobiales bacterium]